jgi:hypothetical protein
VCKYGAGLVFFFSFLFTFLRVFLVFNVFFRRLKEERKKEFCSIRTSISDIKNEPFSLFKVPLLMLQKVKKREKKMMV